MRDLVERPVSFEHGYNMRCAHCPATTPLTSAEYYRQADGAHVACAGCAAQIHFGLAAMTLRDPEDPVLDDRYLLDAAWYHTSTFPDWPHGSRAMPDATVESLRRLMPEVSAHRVRALHENQALHLGSYEAAIESMLRRMSSQDDGGTPFYLYRIALRHEGLAIEPGWRDENSEKAAQISQKELDDADIVRYLNVHESPGSISLAVRPAAIASLQRIPLPVPTARPVINAALLANIDRVRQEVARADAAADTEPSPLELLLRKAAARSPDSSGIGPHRQQPALPYEICQLLENEYLAGVSQPGRDRFTAALRAWRTAHAPVDDADYALCFASMASTLTQPDHVIRLISTQPVRQ
ncbi:hypothetical protein ACIA5G_33655 [Amycolatopsis sp. NPDC051758]|uniref:hypothetical protein n=1 Tax=Amycolatopsis sp. NPDC051758 TaxID=3363935 RepID=UPI00379E814D